MEKVGPVLNEFLDLRGWTQKVLQEMALHLWADVVGPEIARNTRPEGLRGGVMFVRTKNSMWSHELTYHKPRIIARLNGRLRQNVVSDIRFYTTRRRKDAGDDPIFTEKRPPLAKRIELTAEEKSRIAAAARPIHDDAMRAALMRAMESCLKAQKEKEQKKEA
ncbi:MAG: DUF721 domain-containing protein [Abditibacteriales bacterium]|nr:DUF721 domain-containing protein [Abditibacteriales bacterium]MDW8367939.1 DUF721 domain-containing protein [Abditibacteriales bacterium]